MATDLAEFIGAAIGLLILGVSLLQGAVLTGIATFLDFNVTTPRSKPLWKKSHRRFTAFVAAAYIVELFFSASIWRSSAKEYYPGAAEPGSRIL